jgi:hypothetical protein
MLRERPKSGFNQTCRRWEKTSGSIAVGRADSRDASYSATTVGFGEATAVSAGRGAARESGFSEID